MSGTPAAHSCRPQLNEELPVATGAPLFGPDQVLSDDACLSQMRSPKVPDVTSGAQQSGVVLPKDTGDNK